MKKKKSKLKIFAALATVTVVLTTILLMTTDKVEKELPPTQGQLLQGVLCIGEGDLPLVQSSIH
jgi:hypothetical protein